MTQAKADISHDFYLKLFHIKLANKELEYEPVDLLMLDECGDINEVTLEIFKLLPAKHKVLVGDNCIPGHVKIKTIDGWRKMSSIIKQLEQGQTILVASYNQKTNTEQYKKACNPIRTGRKECFKVTCAHSTFECTADHKILTPSGYKYLKDLSIGDLVIKSKPRQEKALPILNKEQKSVLLGSILGDGTINRVSKYSYRLRLGHSKKQYKYLQWKMNIFNIKIYHTIKAGLHTIKGKQTNVQESRTCNSKVFLYPELNKFTIRHLDALALAVWVMDDGALRNKYHSLDKRFSITIESNSFSYKTHLLLQKILNKNFGLYPTIQISKGYYRLAFNKENSIKLRNIIMPYINDAFIKKFKHTKTKVIQPNNMYELENVDIITNIQSTGIQETYDITVEDNHNFVISSTQTKPEANGVIVHNCQNVFAFNGTINAFEIMKDEGRIFTMSQSFRVDKTIAEKIEHFMQTYIDPSSQFKGIDYAMPKQPIKAFISRTNASLIQYMIDCQASKIEYKLVRPAATIFSPILSLATLKRGTVVTEPTYKYLQEDIDFYYTYEEDLKDKYKTVLSYLKNTYPEDISLSYAINLISRHGATKLFSLFQEAKRHENSNAKLYLGTAHSFKGLEADIVTLADDMNDVITKLLDKTREQQLDIRELPGAINEFYLYYVAASRARGELRNAEYIR